MEPMTLFARIADPAGVARLLRDRMPNVELDGPDDAWRNAIVKLAAGTLKFTHDPAYYSEPSWSTQMSGMAGYFSRFPKSERKSIALSLPTTFKFALGILLDPVPGGSHDSRLDVVHSVAKHLDGVLFAVDELRDANGRILFGAGGEDDEDPNAVWPRVVGEVSLSEHRAAPSEAEERIAAPTAARVVKRALAMTAVTARAILEQEGVTVKPRSRWNFVTSFFSSREGERREARGGAATADAPADA